MTRGWPLALLLLGCPGKPDDSGEPPDDSGDTDTDTAAPPDGDELASAWATFTGGPSDAAGNAVAGVGDVSGDGRDDVLVAAYYGNEVCVWFGPIAAGAHPIATADACLTGEDTYDFAGYTVAAVQDVTGDGVSDVLVGAIGNADAGLNAGKAYLLAGPLAPGVSPLADAAASWGGETSGDYAGIGLARAGDLDGDGAPDLLVGASGNDGSGAGGGRAYLITGGFDTRDVPLATIPTTFVGLPLPTKAAPPHGSYGGGDSVGDSMAGVGDVNGDGFDDVLIGAAGDATLGPSTGKAGVFFGPIGAGEHSIEAADLMWRGSAAESYVGSPVGAAGDIDDDGRADYLISADGLGGGTVFLVFGSDLTGDVPIDEADAAWAAATPEDQAGFGLAWGGDVTGDGVGDLLIGAPGTDPDGTALDAGGAWLVEGPAVAGRYALDDAARLYLGEKVGDNAGRSVARGGDLTGDGVADWLVGAIYNDEGGSFGGKAYLLAGGPLAP